MTPQVGSGPLRGPRTGGFTNHPPKRVLMIVVLIDISIHIIIFTIGAKSEIEARGRDMGTRPPAGPWEPQGGRGTSKVSGSAQARTDNGEEP